MTSYFLLIHHRNECAWSILENTHSAESTQRKSKLFFLREHFFMLPDSAFNSVSVVERAEGVVKFHFTFTLFSCRHSCGIVAAAHAYWGAMCPFAGRVHLCSSFSAISQVLGTVITLQPTGFPVYTLIIFSSILQRICFCKNHLYGRGGLDAMSL